MTLVVLVPVGALTWTFGQWRAFGTSAERAAFDVLHLATQAGCDGLLRGLRRRLSYDGRY